jgi:hypothetical protein
MSRNNREFHIWKERDGVREGDRGGRQAGRSGGWHILGKVRFGRDRGRDRDTES